MSQSFGELLRRHRLDAGLTQAGLAEVAGLSEQAVSLLERGVRNRPRKETIRALAAALRLDQEAEQVLLLAGRPRAGAAARPKQEPAVPQLDIPWQLPPTVADFTGREAELATVLAAIRRAGTLTVVTGMGGVGKTTLAVHGGHLAAKYFPDGQLYVKLRGYDPGAALTPSEALGQLLRSLDVRHEAIPGGVDEMATMYRSRLAGRRMLILLDDANSVDQVTPLLPGDPGCATIVTSRRFLASLPGSLIVRLSALAEQDSLQLLSSVAGQQRVAAEGKAAREVFTLTGGLPLAIRLVGARLAARPNWLLKHIADQLQDEHRRLDELGLDHSGVRASFAGSLDELLASPNQIDRDAVRAFDLLSLAEGSEISVQLIARLLDVDEAGAEDLLERLVDLHLLDSIGPRRYRMHDLLRTYAGERLGAAPRSTERVAAIERGLEFYVAASWRIHRLTHPWSGRRPPRALDETGVPEFADVGSALAWIDAEIDGIVDLYRRAIGVPGLAERFGPSLALGLFGYLEIRALWKKMRLIYDYALEAVDVERDPATAGWLVHDRAIPEVEQGHFEDGRSGLLRGFELFEKAGDLAGMARSCSSLSHVCERLDRIDEAISWGERGLELAGRASDPTVLGTSHLALGVLYNRVGRADDAAAAFQASFDLAIAAGNRRSLGRRQRVAATSYLENGQIERGIDHLNAALDVFADEQDPIGLSEALHHLSTARFTLGRHAEAEQSAREALRLAEKYGDTFRQGSVLAVLADILDATNTPDEARALRERAITIFETNNIPHDAEALRARLTAKQ
ncbi:tetratricopeptide repeat protein [Kribbella sp. VKM Ac-2527]|uniref:Tetratricopeptide repeat protein n=1 Tax=Kribbella caucasensis TaxID=2512215 RepID=A0A4R6KQY8_9ACTN|nr:XRE family transcriptional regulator [Kribbella sp. VKM Ac-2527]TDO52269.1 tetratricopeptide repeat protein [Kribbella sp. VKM Ac-2527]